MQKTLLLASSIFAVSLARLAHAQEPTSAAHPITLSAAVGNEQSNFYYTADFNGAYVVFTGTVPVKKSMTKETTSLFSVKIRTQTSAAADFFFDVTKQTPLKKLAAYTVANGTLFDNFLLGRQNATTNYRELFHIPGRGLYQSTSGKKPVLIKAESATKPISGAALRFPEAATNDSTLDEQYRIVLGATDPKKGLEPFISAGSGSATKLLKDLVPGKDGSGASQFTTFKQEVYFVAANPATSKQEIYKAKATVTGNKVAYSADLVTNFGDEPHRMTGTSAGLFYSTPETGQPRDVLVVSEDGANFPYVTTTSGQKILAASMITPSVNPFANNAGFSAFDTATSKFRFAVYDTANHVAKFPELANTGAGATTDPFLITSTGDYYYFSALNSGERRLARNNVGNSTLEFIREATSNAFIVSPKEIAVVNTASFNGTVYFTGNVTVNGFLFSNVLFSMDANAASPVANACLSSKNTLITKAENLRAVTDLATVFRLYFTAPINATDNNSFTTDGLDYGTKPWVVATH